MLKNNLDETTFQTLINSHKTRGQLLSKFKICDLPFATYVSKVTLRPMKKFGLSKMSRYSRLLYFHVYYLIE